MPAEPEDRPGEGAPAPRPRRRGPRRATGGTAPGTWSGPEPRLPGAPAPGAGEESREGGEDHERWLREQRPPHWG
ncbi:hypothetical protein GCM10011374_12070 [Kocuria dechangensis]|uniref:Uncharacterized protein n=1 Tax=Kocuria dechangensis TaxID=1176249 RepID=A0A917GMI4_9MICC|nr:hypothetical protein GCM10011374_12070 [Kocuria dechangensis]